MINLSIRLKEFRKLRGVTQGELAEDLHISQTSVSKYERGLSEPDIEMLISLADYFKISIDELVRGSK